jgi:hypothetical protein
MGGFVYHGDNGPLRTLSLQDIEELVEKDEIEYPIISKEEIKDKSKGDALAKGLVLIQTTWFLLQCVARGAQHLSLTELELATAAFALLNIVTYALWWDKPLNVQCPVQVRKKHVCGQGGGGEVVTGEKETSQGDSQQRSEAVAEGARERTTFVIRVRDWCSSFWHWWSWSNVGKAVKAVFSIVFGPFWFMITADEDDDDDDTFFVGENEDDDRQVKAFLGALVVSMVFGGIHCIGWLLFFPSHTEQLLWRISSVAITGIPLYFMVIGLIATIDNIPDIVKILIVILFLLSPILYLLARVALLVLAFMALRSLPHSALQTVQWTTFIPHV